MTRAYATYVPSTSTAAAYVNTYKPISDAIAAVLTRASDTGQVNWGAVASEPVGAIRDYEMFRFAGPLQATAPMFFRMDYKGGSAASTHGVFVMAGAGSNGAGALTGVTHNAAALSAYAGLASGTQAAYVSSDGESYFTLLYDAEPTGQQLTGTRGMSMVVIERTRDLDGTPNGRGWTTQYWRCSSTGAYTQMTAGYMRSIAAGPSGQGPSIYDFPAPVPNLGPLTETYSNNTATVFPCYTFADFTAGGPSKALLYGVVTEFIRMREVTVTHYGQPMTFLPLGDSYTHPLPYMSGIGTAGTKNMMPLIRWE